LERDLGGRRDRAAAEEDKKEGREKEKEEGRREKRESGGSAIPDPPSCKRFPKSRLTP
jgi:hypothetical protein